MLRLAIEAVILKLSSSRKSEKLYTRNRHSLPPTRMGMCHLWRMGTYCLKCSLTVKNILRTYSVGLIFCNIGRRQCVLDYVLQTTIYSVETVIFGVAFKCWCSCCPAATRTVAGSRTHFVMEHWKGLLSGNSHILFTYVFLLLCILSYWFIYSTFIDPWYLPLPFSLLSALTDELDSTVNQIELDCAYFYRNENEPFSRSIYSRLETIHTIKWDLSLVD